MSITVKRLFALLLIASLFVLIPSILTVAQVPTTARLPTARVAWSPDGSLLAVSFNFTLQILDGETLELLNTLPQQNSENPKFAWSPDSSRLAVINGAVVEVWEKVANEETAHVAITYTAVITSSSEPPVGNALAWSPDGTRIASSVEAGQGDYTLDIWDVETGQQVYITKNYLWRFDTLAWSENNVLATANYNSIRRWDMTSFEPMQQVTISSIADGPSVQIHSLAWKPDDNTKIVMAGSDGTTRIWDTTLPLPVHQAPPLIDEIILREHNRDVLSATWHPSGSMLATTSVDGKVVIWDVGRMIPIEIIPLGTTLQVVSAAWSPDGSKFAYGDDAQGHIVVIDAPAAPAPTTTPTPSNTPLPTNTPTPTPTATPTLPVGAQCILTTEYGVNLRTGPGANYETSGSQLAGASLEADGQYLGLDGFIWWRLVSGEWIREDLVSEGEYCTSFPVIPDTELPAPPTPTRFVTPSPTAVGFPTCTVTTDVAVRIRSLPSAESEQVGGYRAGEILTIYGKAEGADRLVWWRLVTGGWVREDFVVEDSACESLPVLNPEEPVPQMTIVPTQAAEVTCEIVTDLGVNLRSGPGAEFEKIGSAAQAQTLIVNGQFRSTDTFIWWRLTTGEWVREDLVTEESACSSLPIVEAS